MSVPTRPDPDALIERLRQDEARAARGRLRIYFGAAAGVGKTMAMLAAASAAKAAGTDVVVGVVETHGRSETAAQLVGFEVLARKALGASAALAEFDLDAALIRKPALVLVDELAHTNAPGSRHPKRWQDVEELLAAGIDVWTTLNVQHLESLNDVVGGITGIRVQETLPDTFFDRADEVVLVDTTADELIARLKAGKVYAAPQAERAAANFFRKGNLMALRELALRRTADRIETDVQAYRIERSIERVWKTEASLLCCVGSDDDNEHVVRSAALLAQQLATSWHAIYVETPALQRLPSWRRERIVRALRLAEELGAKTAVLPNASIAEAVIDYARRNNLSRIVLGRQRESVWRRPAGALARHLGRRAGDVDVIEIGAPARSAVVRRPAADTEQPRRWRIQGYVAAVAACAGLTAIGIPLGSLLDEPNLVMLYLLAVVVVALRHGRGPSVLAAIVNVAAFDFFFVPPRLSFSVSDIQYVVTFAVMLAVGLVIGQLTAGMRYQARVATHRERRSHELYEAARELSSALATEQVVEAVERAVGREFRAAAKLFILDPHDRLVASAVAGPDGPDPATARWSFDHDQPAGVTTDTLPGGAWLYVPLKAPMRTRGVLALRAEEPARLLVPEQRRHLETFATLAATALERVHYVEVAQQATVQIESERLRNTLLESLSHDLRTPLAALAGSAERLTTTSPPLSAEQSEIVEALHASALRLATQVNNILDMARIESGQVKLRREWQSVEELVGSALRSVKDTLAPRTVRTDIPADLPLVECDAVLIERVLVNLLENAGKYTPPDSHVVVVARAGDSRMTISVADDGPGIRPALEPVVFDKFTRGDRESALSGVGLGLAICKSIVEAHGGTIAVTNTAPHGAVFSFSLPLAEAPTLEPGELSHLERTT